MQERFERSSACLRTIAPRYLLARPPDAKNPQISLICGLLNFAAIPEKLRETANTGTYFT